MADARDLKSLDRKVVPVQVRSRLIQQNALKTPFFKAFFVLLPKIPHDPIVKIWEVF